jgi:hypothetical protein
METVSTNPTPTRPLPPLTDTNTGLIVTIGSTTYQVTADPNAQTLTLPRAECTSGGFTIVSLTASSSHGNLASGVYGGSGTFDAVVGETQSDAHAGVTGRNLTTGANGGVGVYGAGGEFAGKFDGHVQINGKTWIASDALVSGDVILVNPSASDIAEDFDVEDEQTNLEPGTVLVINPEGKLCASRLPYDTRVAGVVSGAGDFRPGVVLQRVSSPTPRSPIALLGKVFCKVDASFGGITGGDLLTTSETPGYAMKASDRSRALGAIIGKALASLNSGRGLIPIMVTVR